jgi:DNA-binding CsgD family transcriptional regulator
LPGENPQLVVIWLAEQWFACDDLIVNAMGGHAAQFRVVHEFLHAAESWPGALLIEGEPGIGKTTMLQWAREQAAQSGMRVLTARPGPAEATLPYCGIADFLDGLHDGTPVGLPSHDRTVLDRLAQRREADHHEAATAFLTVLRELSAQSPVLLAVDDADWLDAASRKVLRFAASRLPRATGILMTAQPPRSDRPSPASWLRLPFGSQQRRISLQPLTLGSLNTVLTAQLGHRLPKRIVTRIHRVSGGNIYSALELAHSVRDEWSDIPARLPVSLAQSAGRRIGELDGDRAKVLLALACLEKATSVELRCAAQASADEVTAVIDGAESRGIVSVDGTRISFTHPLLAYAVYSDANGPERRAMHRRLAVTTADAEARARHLALGGNGPDEHVLQALDHAAASAVQRGAPATAAELLDLALQLGDDDPDRVLRSAEQHYFAGHFDDAKRLLDGPVAVPRAALLRGTILGHYDAPRAISTLMTAREHPSASTRLSLLCHFTGDFDSSVTHADEAVETARSHDDPALLSSALAVQVFTKSVLEQCIDTTTLKQALELEDHTSAATPAALTASGVAAVMFGWAGDLVGARAGISAVLQRSLDNGKPMDFIWAAQFSTTYDLWVGDVHTAAQTAARAVEEAELIGDHASRAIALASAAAVAAHRGLDSETHDAARSAIEAASTAGLQRLIDAPTASIGFVETSHRLYDAALRTLAPLLARSSGANGIDLATASCLPDAIEALSSVGRIDEAEALVDALEVHGARLDHGWMSAASGRGRAAVAAARGDLRAAEAYADHAMVIHDRLPMPFERARTQLLLGQIQRRRRRRPAALANITAAVTSLSELGSTAWAQRAASELRIAPDLEAGTQGSHVLTPAERRVAERAGAGLSNRDIAAELFVSVKTVEMNLSRVYRKLGIRSRAQLHDKLNRGR